MKNANCRFPISHKTKDANGRLPHPSQNEGRKRPFSNLSTKRRVQTAVFQSLNKAKGANGRFPISHRTKNANGRFPNLSQNEDRKRPFPQSLTKRRPQTAVSPNPSQNKERKRPLPQSLTKRRPQTAVFHPSQNKERKRPFLNPSQNKGRKRPFPNLTQNEGRKRPFFNPSQNQGRKRPLTQSHIKRRTQMVVFSRKSNSQPIAADLRHDVSNHLSFKAIYLQVSPYTLCYLDL